jgi:hypothetical protein
MASPRLRRSRTRQTSAASGGPITSRRTVRSPAHPKRWRQTSHHEIRRQRIRTRKGTASRLTWSPQDRSDSPSRQPSGVSPEIAARNHVLSCNINTLVGGGDGGIRTLDRALQPYNGLANRRLQPLGHVSRAMPREICPTHPPIASDAGRAWRAAEDDLPGRQRSHPNRPPRRHEARQVMETTPRPAPSTVTISSCSGDGPR